MGRTATPGVADPETGRGVNAADFRRAGRQNATEPASGLESAATPRSFDRLRPKSCCPPAPRECHHRVSISTALGVCYTQSAPPFDFGPRIENGQIVPCSMLQPCMRCRDAETLCYCILGQSHKVPVPTFRSPLERSKLEGALATAGGRRFGQGPSGSGFVGREGQSQSWQEASGHTTAAQQGVARVVANGLLTDHRARLSKAEATRVGHIHRNTITS
eukprot:COSAG05_NODE_89_length_20177_cov_197.003586_11_plen_218_part_00